MKITIFNGSPRAENGNTHIMVAAFMKGAMQAGAEVENVFLLKKEINHCRGCFSCWLKTPGKCVIRDDMAELLEKFVNSDIVVFATPLYVDNVTGIMKNFMDRIIPVADPHFGKDEGGECVHTMAQKIPKLVVISNSGFPEQSHFQVLELLFKRVARNMRTEVVGEIYRGAGSVLKEVPFILKPIIHRYKKLLQTAGREIVENQQLSAETRTKLEKPLISDERYITSANEYFDKMLSDERGDILN
ncbi:MAG: flavodoxin family protein [Phycisphaerales bacterium]